MGKVLRQTMADEKPQETTTPTAEEQAQAEAKAKADAEAKKAAEDAELAAKAEKKANLEKAINEAEETLRKKREAIREVQPAPKTEEEPSEVVIDLNDPGAKAWDKHIKETVSPVLQEVEREKAEVRNLALREFLADKPALANNPDKVKELVDVYDRIKTATERNKDAVVVDLKRAFGALYSEQLIEAARTGKVERAKELELFSDPAVDKGATAYVNEPERNPNLTEEDRQILARWGMTPEQWFATKKETDAKK